MKPLPAKIQTLPSVDGRTDFPDLEGSPMPLVEKVRHLTALGDEANLQARFEEALDHYRTAIALRKAGGLQGRGEAVLRVNVARCLLRLGRPTEALPSIESAARILLGTGAGDDPVMAPADGEFLPLEVELQWAEVYAELGDYRRAAEHAGAAGAALADSGAMETSSRGLHHGGRLHNLLGHIAARRGDIERAEREFEEAVALFRRAGDLAGLAHAFNNMGLALKNRCQWSKARELLAVSQRLRAEGEEESPHGGALLNLGILHLKLGEWREAAEAFETSLAQSVRRGDTQNQVRALLALGDLHRLRREFAACEEILSRAVALAETHRYMRELALGMKLTGELAAARHRLSNAQDYYDRAEAVASRIAPEGDLMTELMRLHGELALQLGDGSGALARARGALARAQRSRDPYEEALVHGLVARACDSLGDVTAAHEAHLQCTQSLKELGARHPLAHALVAFAAHLRREPSERGQARLLLREALARFEECGDAMGPALVRLEGARLELASAHVDAAVELLAQAAVIVREHGEPREAERLHEVEGQLEEAMVSQSLAARRVTHRARNGETAGAHSHDAIRENIRSVVEDLARSCAADGVFLAMRRRPSAPMDILVTCGVPERWARMLGRDLPGQIEGPMAEGVPLVVLDASREDAPRLPATEGPRQVACLLTVPLRLGGGAQGFLYLDRVRGADGPPLGQKDLNLALTVTEELVSFVTEMDLRERSEDGLDLRKKLSERIAFADVVTQNREMFEILRLVGKVAATSMTVLIQGETGTGKQLIAHAIHASSNRRDRPFVTIDCAALPENLLESELFGYRRGAFTGATQDRKGLVEEADGGTIFLDEICKAGLGVQQRLLHLLDCGEIRSVGATSYRRLDVRIISATSIPDLRREVEEGRFLKDLYYRLNDFAVTVPPLRDRREDVLLLSEHFLARFCGELGREILEISRAALKILLEYEWPGNVRELLKVMRRAAVLADDGEPILPEHLPAEIGHGAPEADGEEEAATGKLKEAVDHFERRLILATLERVGWNKSRAAEELGLSRKGLRNKISRMELDRRAARSGRRSAGYSAM